eukprot:scpid82825/ scgid20798/ UPF0308 protein C9orf21 homolog
MASTQFQPEEDGIEEEFERVFSSELPLSNGLGQHLLLKSLYRDKKAIIIFVRHFLCYVCRDYMKELARIPVDVLDKINVRLVVIGCSPHKHINPLKEELGFKHDVYCDAERVVYRGLGLNTTLALGKASSQHVTSSLVGGLTNFVTGAVSTGLQGDVRQQGGAFIVAQDGTVEFWHRDSGSLDHAPIDDLLAHVGARPLATYK